jgi:hypothetical protein
MASGPFPFELWPPDLPERRERVSITATLVVGSSGPPSGGCVRCASCDLCPAPWGPTPYPRGYPRRLWTPPRRHCPAPLGAGGPIASSALLAVFPQPQQQQHCKWRELQEQEQRSRS